MQCGMSSSAPGLYPLEASNDSPKSDGTTQNVSRHRRRRLAEKHRSRTLLPLVIPLPLASVSSLYWHLSLIKICDFIQSLRTAKSNAKPTPKAQPAFVVPFHPFFRLLQSGPSTPLRKCSAPVPTDKGLNPVSSFHCSPCLTSVTFDTR